MKSFKKYKIKLCSAILFCCFSGLLLLSEAVAQSTENEVKSAEELLILSKKSLSDSPINAFDYSQNALHIALDLQNDSLVAKSYKACGTACYQLKNYPQSLVYWDSALIFFEKTNNTRQIGLVLNNLGIAHGILGHYQTSVDYLIKSLQTKRQLNDSVGMAHIYNNLGSIYYKLNAFKEALPYFEMATEIATKCQDFTTEMNTTNNIGLIYTELGRYDEALRLLKKTMMLAGESGNTQILAGAIQNIGNVFLFKNMSDSSLYYFNKGQMLFEKIGIESGQTKLGIGKSWALKGNHDKALIAYHEALRIGEKSGDQKLRVDALRNIYEASKAKGNRLLAYEASERYISLFDSVKILFDSTAIMNLMAKNEVNEKMLEIESLTKRNIEHEQQLVSQKKLLNTQKTLLFLSIVTIIIFIGLVFLLLRLSRKYKKTSIELEEQNRVNLKTSTDLRVSNINLSEQEELLRTLIEASPDIILFKDGEGRWLKANDAMLKLFDLLYEDYQFLTDLQLSERKPFYADSLKACIISDENTWNQRQTTRNDEVIPLSQGGFKIIDTIKVALFNSDGSRKGIIIIGRDITQRKEAEVHLNTALRKAEESDKLKSAFLANISHEIRTPLNAIIGFSDLLKDDDVFPMDRNEYLRLIQENGEILLSFINDIIDLAQHEAGETKITYSQIDLMGLMKEMHQHFSLILKNSKKSKIDFQVEFPEDELIIVTDILKIRQILSNILNNSIKFTDQGFIKLKLELVKKGAENHDYFQFVVSDSGFGISEESKGKIFERFTKFSGNNDRLYAGVGLGLSLVEKNVKLLDGYIEVESFENQGTTFVVGLPLVYSKLLVKKKFQKFIADFHGKTILIVEDNDSSLELLKAILEPTGAYIMHAGDGVEAIEFCQNYRQLNLVLMDIQLPLMNGFEATRIIKKLRTELPVVAQTAYALPAEKEACFAAGCDAYFAKPIRSELLLPVLKELML